MDIYEYIVQEHGSRIQKVVAIEEMGELIQALTKDLRGNPDIVNITEEMADVSICLKELLAIYQNEEQVNHTKREKLQRELRRIKEAYTD